MKVEIEVELPEHVAAEYEVVRIGVPTAEDVVIAYGRVTKFDSRCHDPGPRLILRRKDNPCDWWPQCITAEKMTFQECGLIRFEINGEEYICIRDNTTYVDLSRIPAHVKRSGRTIKNPWKEMVQ